jgi:hypothetical protein
LRIKDASTASVATDPSLVVALSPNSPLPAGSSVIGAVTQSGTWTNTVTQATASNLNATVVGAGTAGTPSGGVVSVQGVSGGTVLPISAAALPLPTGAATASNQTTLGTQTTEINDGTHTATIKAASTAAVATDTSLVVALSPNAPIPTGANVIGAVTQSGTWTATVTQTTAANLNATVAQGAPNTTANSWPTTVTDGTHGPAAVKAASTAAVATDPALVVAISPNNTISTSNLSVGLTGTTTPTSATLVGGTDGTNLIALKIKDGSTAAVAADPSLVVAFSPNSPLPAGAAVIGAVTQSGTWTTTVTQATAANLNATVVGVGTAGTPSGGVVSVQGVSGGTVLPISATALPLPTGAATASNQTTLGTQTTEINDGTHTASIKAASTAASATDTSLVVALSPNSSIPTGANVIGAVTQSGTWTATVTQATAANLNATMVGAGTAGTPTGGVVSVQGVSGGTVLPISATSLPLPTGAATASNQTTIGTQTTQINDGTRTATIKAASTASVAGDTSLVVALSPNSPIPTGSNVIGALTANQSVNLTQIGGTAIVTGGVAGSQGVGGLAAAGAAASGNPVQVGSVFNTTAPAPTSGNVEPLQSDLAGNLLTFPGLQFATGAAWTSGTALNTLQYANGTTTIGQLAGVPAVIVQLDQTTTLTGGAVTFQGTFDGVNWVAIPTAQVLNPNTFATLANPYTFVPSTNQPFLISTQGYVAVRANLTTVITGTGSVTPYWSTLATLPVAATGDAVTAAQGAPNSLANAWPFEITDGTHGPAAVKAASTAAVAADTSLVVALSPNSPIPTGANVIGAVTQSGTWTSTVTQATAANLNATVVGAGTAGTPTGGVLTVQGASGGTTLPISAAALPLPTGAATSANQTTIGTQTTQINDGTRTATIKAASTAAAAADTSLVVALSPNSPIPTGSNTIGSLTANQSVNLAQVGGTTTVTGGVAGSQGVGGLAASGSAVAGNPVLVAGSDGTNARALATSAQGNLITEYKPATTSSLTSVAANAASVSLLAANVNRLQALITNDGTGIMFVALAATATTAAYTYRVTADSQVIIDGYWTGAISAIWTAPNGNARITELTP